MGLKCLTRWRFIGDSHFRERTAFQNTSNLSKKPNFCAKLCRSVRQDKTLTLIRSVWSGWHMWHQTRCLMSVLPTVKHTWQQSFVGLHYPELCYFLTHQSTGKDSHRQGGALFSSFLMQSQNKLTSLPVAPCQEEGSFLLSPGGDHNVCPFLFPEHCGMSTMLWHGWKQTRPSSLAWTPLSICRNPPLTFYPRLRCASFIMARWEDMTLALICMILGLHSCNYT